MFELGVVLDTFQHVHKDLGIDTKRLPTLYKPLAPERSPSARVRISLRLSAYKLIPTDSQVTYTFDPYHVRRTTSQRKGKLVHPMYTSYT